MFCNKRETVITVCKTDVRILNQSLCVLVLKHFPKKRSKSPSGNSSILELLVCENLDISFVLQRVILIRERPWREAYACGASPRRCRRRRMVMAETVCTTWQRDMTCQRRGLRSWESSGSASGFTSSPCCGAPRCSAGGSRASTVHRPPSTVCCSPFTVHRPLFVVNCLLFTVHHPLFAVHSFEAFSLGATRPIFRRLDLRYYSLNRRLKCASSSKFVLPTMTCINTRAWLSGCTIGSPWRSGA